MRRFGVVLLVAAATHAQDGVDFESAKAKRVTEDLRCLLLDEKATADRFVAWLRSSSSALGVALEKRMDLVLEFVDRARGPEFEKVKPGVVERKLAGFPGLPTKVEYDVLVPPGYDPAERKPYAMVLSLRGRQADAMKLWTGVPAANEAVVVAPQGGPFVFGDEEFGDLMRIYTPLANGLRRYRVDARRVFLEVEGSGLRLAAGHGLVFAGIIYRDDDSGKPGLPKDRLFSLVNLNRVPFLYIADDAHFDTVGRPLLAKLREVYAAAPRNLVVVRARRDEQGVLRADPSLVRGFVSWQRSELRRRIHWRFLDMYTMSPLPVYVIDTPALSGKKPLAQQAWTLDFLATGNRFDIKLRGATKATLLLDERMVDFDKPVTIVVNGTTMRSGLIERDWKTFFEQCMRSRYFMLRHLAAVELTVPK